MRDTHSTEKTVANFNDQINPPKHNQYPAEIMPCRARQIKTVISRHQSDHTGGATVISTGTVFIPTGNDAYERTIRYHEAMHAAHTDRKQSIIDMLDQALEDARLHRYCSKAAESQFDRARRDELTVALRDLRNAKRQEKINPSTALVTLRAMAILTAGPASPRSMRLLNVVLARFGDTAKKDFTKALRLLADVDNWKQARKAIKQYFKSEFESSTPAPKFPAPAIKSEKADTKEDETNARIAPPPSLIDEDEDPEPEEHDEDAKESEEQKPEESDKDGDESSESADGSDSESEDSDSESDSSSDESGDSESEDSDSGSESDEPGDGEDSDLDTDDSDMAAAVPPRTVKPRESSDPDLYQADLTPACDAENYNKMDAKYPLKLYIRRLDMSINRVKLSMGRKAPLPVTSGRKILARKLGGALSNPSSRVFARSVSRGGHGTILIDASGSMSIPEQTLIDFLANAPALTVAFYNAPNDMYGSGCDYTKHGNIFIYAANGYRASIHNLKSADDYGIGNMIDYQAMAWLLKQPAPHYMVTDKRWTGPWSDSGATEGLCQRLVAAQQLIIMRNLKEMGEILDKLAKTR
jgi:hypothetical protein